MHKSWETRSKIELKINSTISEEPFSLQLSCQLLLNLTLGFPFCFQENL